MIQFTDLEIPFDEAENYLQANNKSKLNKLFYKDENFNKLLQDTTYFLVGDKGSGKTTYSAYFCNNMIEGNIRSKRYVVTVDDYNKIIQMKKEGKLNYSHYVTLWKAIILIKLFATIDDSEISLWGGKAHKAIKDLLTMYNFTRFSIDEFSPVSLIDNEKFVKNFGGALNVEGLSLNASMETEKEQQRGLTQHVFFDSWVYFINTLLEGLSKLRLKNNHYLFIDGIDSRPTDIKFDDYKKCVYPLVRAVYEINAEILSKVKDRNKGRLQVILLTRLDIFVNSGLGNPGSKLSDNAAFLNWGQLKEDCYDKSGIYALVNNIINSNSVGEEKLTWNNFFNFRIKRDGQEFDSFAYFLRTTTARPRDFVKILKIVQEQCIRQSANNPTQDMVKSDLFMRSYSTYFTDSIRTMLSFYYDPQDIKLLLRLLDLLVQISLIISFSKRNSNNLLRMIN